MPKTVGVAVSHAAFHFDKLYTYAVMPDQQDQVRLGSMVLVPFGRSSRPRMGVVLACDAEPESARLKALFDVAPASACLTGELLELVRLLKERTFCTWYEAVRAVIPYGAQYKPALAADGVTPVLQKQLTRHTETLYRPAARQAPAHRQADGGGGPAVGRAPHPGRPGGPRGQPGRGGKPLRQGGAGGRAGEQIHRPLRPHPPQDRASGADRRAAGRLRRPGPPFGGGPAPRRPAVRRHRQRQDPGVPQADRAVPGPGQKSPGAGARSA